MNEDACPPDPDTMTPEEKDEAILFWHESCHQLANERDGYLDIAAALWLVVEQVNGVVFEKLDEINGPEVPFKSSELAKLSILTATALGSTKNILEERVDAIKEEVSFKSIIKGVVTPEPETDGSSD